jgi:hypothetical protein
MILVTDAAASAVADSGITRFYCFAIDDPIPTLVIPLLDVDAIQVDFGVVYNFTFADDRRAQFLLDYEQEPLNIEAYHVEDRPKIRKTMERIASENPR